MPLGTLDRTPPPFFRQGPSALTRLAVFSLLAVLLMAADSRYQLTRPLRASIATAIYPLQWLVLQPVRLVRHGGDYFESLSAAQAALDASEKKLNLQSVRAGQVEQLSIENTRLRELLALRARLGSPGQAAQVIYDAADPYTRKVVIDQGAVNGVALGSPVLDESGVLGQVTRVYPLVSEVTLVTDRDQAIPVLNTRTGVRGLAFGDPASRGGGLELRFMAANADVLPGDLLTTSGVDGVYPAGLPVARVAKVERQGNTAFAQISCQALAQVSGVEHVLVLAPLATVLAPPPEPEARPSGPRKGGRR
ncbi:MAG: rod shape-determining protein MreC [Rhodoferax sp.]|nr:rod shape-determining protein MreC [Rhodoferax sp.]